MEEATDLVEGEGQKYMREIDGGVRGCIEDREEDGEGVLRFWKVGRKDGSAGEGREDRQNERLD